MTAALDAPAALGSDRGRSPARGVVLRACAGAVPRRALGLHLLAAVLLLGAAWEALDDDRPAVAVLRGVALLLAAGLALAVDEPGAALLDASPTSTRRRLGARLAVCAAAAAPVWAAALAVAAWRGAVVSSTGLTLELAAMAALGLAVTTSLRRWWRVGEPAVVAGPLLLGFLLGAAWLPRDVRLLVSTPLDPAWSAAHLRWSLLLLAALGLLAAALAEPATAGRRRPAVHRGSSRASSPPRPWRAWPSATSARRLP